ncbi:MAG: ElyC/SanA/YdcF family protein [Melioribacteraceae bacterium]
MNTNSKYIFTTIAIALLNLLLLFFIKYSHNGLTFEEFDINKFGNLFNLSFVFILVFGCLFLLTRLKQIHSSKVKSLLYISFLYIFLLLVVLGLDFIGIKYLRGYLFGYPYKKIIPMILLIANQSLVLYLIFIVWLIYFKKTLLSYFTSILLVASTIGIFVVFSFLSTYSIEEVTKQKLKNSNDIGIVLGAAVWSGNKPSPIFTGRIEKSNELYSKGIIKKIQLTGSNAPGEVSEARAAYNYLLKKYSVNEKDILIEENTRSTNEQIRFIKEKLNNKNSSNVFIIISDDFHLKRILEMAKFFNINAIGISSDYKLNWEKSIYYRFRDSIGLLLFWTFGT